MRLTARLLATALLLACAPAPAASTRLVLDLSGPGWRLLLDEQAPWASDPLHLPGVDLATLPSRAPTGGWAVLADGGEPVVVPGTVEGATWERVGDYRGVSWWWRELELPEAARGRRVELQFDAVRLRAEVFLDEQLVGYDAVGNTPFSVDLGGAAPGRHRLAVRVTDPGGNFDWIDHTAHTWGQKTIPASHGFGGITGPVRLVVSDAVHVADVFVETTPAVTDVVVHVELGNGGPDLAEVGLTVALLPADGAGEPLASGTWRGAVPAGGHTVDLPLSAPGAGAWSLDDPNLHLCRVTLSTGDELVVRFGFRWFAPDGLGEDAVLRLNGRRIVLRSAISWGFWPGSGLVPTPELAERQVAVAKELGLTMLNHHRTIAAPGLLDVHDELGLLAHLEPGGYWSQGGDELCFRLARAKWLRMVERDRNHPSVVIYNLINEATDPPDARAVRDLDDAFALDPTRVITYTSAWADDDEPRLSLHRRPGDPRRHREGWHDQHNAPGPGVWRDEFWNGPDDHRRRTERRSEIVFWGEDGAIGAPPRLSRVADALAGGPPGWDGAHYLAWRDAYTSYFAAKGLEDEFADLDALLGSLGDVAYDYQARVLENVRLGDVTDGYVINGWECEALENHSGIVDCWRHPKGSAERLARANAPLVLAVKLRTKLREVGRRFSDAVRAPAVVLADVYVVNELDLSGEHVLELGLHDSEGNELWSDARVVTLLGGDVFGQPLWEGLELQVDGAPGRYRLAGRLLPARGGEPLVTGEDELLLVDWRIPELPGQGALLDGAGRLATFLADERDLDLPAFTADLPPLDYVLVADVDAEPVEELPADALTPPDGAGAGPGLLGEYRQGLDPQAAPALSRIDPVLDFSLSPREPAPGLTGPAYTVRWRGRLHPPETGSYRFHTLSAGGVRLWVDGRLVLDRWEEHGPERDASLAVELHAGQPVDLRLEYFQEKDASRLRLRWTRPAAIASSRERARELVRRVAEDGTTLAILGEAEGWARLLDELGAIRYRGKLTMGRYWMGGSYFARPHALLDRLPAGGALGWEYQELVHYALPGSGLLLEGEEPVVACVSDHQHQVATALGIVRHGKGRILLSTLDLVEALPEEPGPRDAVALLLVNVIRWAGAP